MDEIRYGVIGTGMMGVEHIANVNALPGARVVAIADPHEPSRDAGAAAAADPVSVYADHRDLLAAGECDAVVIASPNMTHVDVLADVLATDVHVLVEKPLCTTVDDCERVVAMAADRQAMVWVGLEYRYMPPVAALVRAVRDGAVGRPHMIAIREHRFPFLVKVGDWNRFNRNTGGTLVEKCCHFFDLMNLIADSDPVRVFASGGQAVNHLDERYDGETPDILDHAFVTVEYANGIRAMLDLCMFAEATHHQEAGGRLAPMLPELEHDRTERHDHDHDRGDLDVVLHRVDLAEEEPERGDARPHSTPPITLNVTKVR
jgi:myo-inositol 2-dehydrogenase/D-chiro-inositol 1-dehydrogenase